LAPGRRRAQARHARKVGIFLESLSLQDTFRFARLADRWGFHSIWLPEITWSDAFSLATAAAMSTKRVKIATGVVGIFGRSPALMAMSIAGLDELSNGRAILGLGTQARPYVELWHSVKFEKPLLRMKEYVTALRKILLNPFNLTYFKGEIFDIEGFVLTAKPKNPHIPIFVAAIGPRMQRVAGEVGDGVLGYLYSLRYLKEHLIPNLREGAEKAGRDVKEIEIAVGLPALISDSDDRFEMIKPLVAVFTVATGSSPSYQTILNELGYADNVKKVKQKMREGDVKGAVKYIPDEMAREVTLCGTKREVNDRIEEYRKNGVTLPLLNPTPPYAYYPLFPTHLPDSLGAGSVDYKGLRSQVRTIIESIGN
jgi:alkanesulfonate monooxygenase SsuD/methylene tetrahydromethanopterin reductase-like flavin-dependent oxidoreductase (luciferase family)